MKKYTILLSILTLFLSACSDPHEYNKEADKKCEDQLQSSVNKNELLLYALKSDASPYIIERILEEGASASTTVGEGEIPIICYAKSPKAVKIIYNAHPENKKKKGPAEIIFNGSLNKPIFYYQTPELCEAYFKVVTSNVDYGDYEINLEEKPTKFSLTIDVVMKRLLNQKDKYERTPLFYAKNKQMIDYWMNKGYNLNDFDKYGNNVLGYKIQKDKECNIDVLSYLIEKGADVNFGIDKGHKTPLVLALEQNKNKDIIEFLITKGANVNAGEDKGNVTPLGYALLNNSKNEIIDLLIAKGAKVENVNSTSNLFYCVQNPAQIEFLKGKGLSPDIVTEYGFYINANGNKYVARTPLAKVIGIGLGLDTVKALIESGAEVDKAFLTLGKRKISAFNFSVSVLKNRELIALLLKNGAEKSFDIDIVFDYFVEEKNAKMISELLTLGANIDNSSKTIDKVFDLLLANGDTANLKKMISNGYNVNKKNINEYMGYSFRDKQNENIKKFNILIELGYDVNQRNENGRNVLDELMSGVFSSVKLGNISETSFERIIKNTTSLKDRGYATKTLNAILSENNLREKILEIFLSNCPSIDQYTLKNTLISQLTSFSTLSESSIIALIKYIDDLNGKIKEKTMIAYALEYKNVSFEMIKAICTKMYFPNMKTKFKYFSDEKFPSDIAKELGRNDIAEYLADEKHYTYIDEKGNVVISYLYLGMDKKEFDRIPCTICDGLDVEFDANGKLSVLRFVYRNSKVGSGMESMFSKLGISEKSLVKEPVMVDIDKVKDYRKYMPLFDNSYIITCDLTDSIIECYDNFYYILKKKNDTSFVLKPCEYFILAKNTKRYPELYKRFKVLAKELYNYFIHLSQDDSRASLNAAFYKEIMDKPERLYELVNKSEYKFFFRESYEAYEKQQKEEEDRKYREKMKRLRINP